MRCQAVWLWGTAPADVFRKAWQCDPLSNFGSVDVFNFTMDEELARAIVEPGRNVEVVYAPDYEPAALEVLAGRKPLRVVRMGARLDETSQDHDIEIKRVAGGLLVQKRFDSRITSHDSVDIVSQRKPTQEELDAAIFNWTVACFTRSNAIVIGSRDKVHGIGSGQRSRIDAAEDAIGCRKGDMVPKAALWPQMHLCPFPMWWNWRLKRE